MKMFYALIVSTALAGAAHAEAPEIVAVQAEKAGMSWRIHVTISHPDSGWDHYADGWEVLDNEGHILGHRELMHPHVHEQPFTRSLNNVMIPDGVREVFVRASCSVENWTSEPVEVSLPY